MVRSTAEGCYNFYELYINISKSKKHQKLATKMVFVQNIIDNIECQFVLVQETYSDLTWTYIERTAYSIFSNYQKVISTKLDLPFLKLPSSPTSAQRVVSR